MSATAGSPETADAVRARGIGKQFPGVIANHDVDVTIRRGTVHALVGENGAGKSTLMKILYGVQRPDGGTLTVNGEEVTFHSPTDAISHGIGMVFQHFMLADNLTVLENVVLGSEKLHGIGDQARAEDPRDLGGLRVRPRPRRAGRGPRGRRAAAGGDPQGPLPRRPDHHPRRADRRAGAAGGRRAVRQPARAQGRGAHHPLHLPQARRGAGDRRRHHRHAPRHDRGRGQAGCHDEATARRAHGRVGAALARDRRVDRHRRGADRRGGDHLARRLRPGPARRRQPDHPPRRGARHRRRGGQRPGGARRDHHGYAQARGGQGHRGRQGHHRLGDPRPTPGRDRLHPRRPAPARAPARRAPVGEPHPGLPEAAPGDQGVPHRPRRCPQGHRPDRRAVRRPDPRDRHPRPRSVRRQPAEADRRPRDER